MKKKNTKENHSLFLAITKIMHIFVLELIIKMIAEPLIE